MNQETFICGYAEAIEAEYGYQLEGSPFLVIQMYNDDFCGLIGFSDRQEIKAELEWCEPGQVMWLDD